MSKSNAGKETAHAAGPVAVPILRDPVMDLARVCFLAVVVVGHLLMLGASVDVDGKLVLERTLARQPWFTPATWIALIVPLFFVIGGLVGAQAWRRTAARGGTAAEFIRGRFLRLARPAIPLFACLSVAILVMRLAGLDADTADKIATGVTLPLWFLAAYTFCQAFLPGMTALHDRAPILTLGGLAIAAIALDVIRNTTGIQELGLLNMIFVWLFIQQLGIWATDGWFAARSRGRLVLLAVASYATLGLITTVGRYPANILDNLNPPTVVLAVLAIAQFSLLMLLHPLLTRAMRGRAMQVIVSAVGSRLMTVYLWHLPILALIVGLLLLTPLPPPAPGSGMWWATRPVILLVGILVLIVVARVLGRFERPVPSYRWFGFRVSDWSIGISTSLLMIPPFTVMVFGLNLVVAVTGTLFLMVAVFLQRPTGNTVQTRPANRSYPTVHEPASRERAGPRP